MKEKQIKMFEGSTNILVQFPVSQVEDLDTAAERLNWSRNKLIRFCCEYALEKTELKTEGEK
jgi:hypothetical protein